MKVKVTEKIMDYDNNPLKEGEVKISQQLIRGFEKLSSEQKINGNAIIEMLKKEFSKEPITFREVINFSLNSIYVGEDGKNEIMSAADKAKAYEITKKVFASKEPDFTDDQIKFIIDRVDKIYLLPVICGRIKEFFKR